MSRFPRLFRALQTLLLAGVRVIITPSWTRDFLGYVYSYRPLPFTTAIRAVSLEEVLPGVAWLPVQVRKCFSKHGNMTGEEIIAVCLLVRWAAPKGIFEFGTFNGNTTLQMAINAPSDCRIWTLNLPLDHSDTQLMSSAQDKMVHPRLAGSGQAFQGEPEAARIQELFGDSAKFDYRPYAGQCDLVLVDAGHEYDYVKSDTENAFRLLAPEGGLIVWHDFPNAPGVCAWLEELSAHHAIFHLQNTRLAFTQVGALRRTGAAT